MQPANGGRPADPHRVQVEGDFRALVAVWCPDVIESGRTITDIPAIVGMWPSAQIQRGEYNLPFRVIGTVDLVKN